MSLKSISRNVTRVSLFAAGTALAACGEYDPNLVDGPESSASELASGDVAEETAEELDEGTLGQSRQALVVGTYAIGWARFHAGTVAADYEFHEKVESQDTYPFRRTVATGTTSATRLSAGFYRIRFPGIGVSGGTAHATAMGGSHTCKVSSWTPSGADQDVNIVCHDRTGLRVDGSFTLLFYRDDRVKSTIPGHAYLWADNPTAASYTPNSAWQFNSRGGVNTIRRLGTGRYEVTLPNMERRSGEPNKGGTVQVTAYGSGSERCKVEDWLPSGNSMRAFVRCMTVGGALLDTRFTLSYMRSPADFATFTAEDKRENFYVWSTASGSAPALYQSNSYGQGGASVQFFPQGTYVVRLPNVKPGSSSNAIVTAYGTDDTHCSIDYWAPDAAISGSQVGISCRYSGGLKNSAFDLLYSTDQNILF